MLLLLDNFEQVIDAAPTASRSCSSGAPSSRCSSRAARRCRVRGEHLLAVPPLSLPPVDAGQVSAEAVAGSEAVRLFVERAREARPSFALTDDNAVGGRRDQRPPRRPAARDRARGGAAAAVLTRRAEGSTRQPARAAAAAGRATCRRDSDAPGHDRVELRAARRRGAALFQLLAVFSPTRVEAVEEVAARLDSLRDVRRRRRTDVAHGQEPGPQRRRARLAAAVDARDDPGVRVASGWRTTPSWPPPRDGRMRSTSRTSRAAGGSASTGPSGTTRSTSSRPSSGTCSRPGGTGSPPGTSSSSRGCSTRCGSSTTRAAGTTRPSS